ncbi:PadR family transcriptional regulator [Longibaculum muris]|uniref:PadR family transcriptional regulator n=1 Tax=Longibaculum muris TaxID=1796628 RepID=UPI0022E74503|nr:PadR family transcriptional regulator [Longibaculum muris]
MGRGNNNFFKIEMLVLKLLSIKDFYGYELTQLLKKLSNNNINIAEGTLYPILYKLLDQGYISDKKILVTKRQSRIYYHIEDKGKIYLDSLNQEYLQMIDYINLIMQWKGENNE